MTPDARNQNELYHHGILGQKWGIRRYQNADGGLTSAGAKRYAKDSAKLDKLISKRDKTNTKYMKAATRNAKIQSTLAITDIGLGHKKHSAYNTERLKGKTIKTDQAISKQVDSMIKRYGSSNVSSEQVETGKYYGEQAIRALDIYKN